MFPRTDLRAKPLGAGGWRPKIRHNQVGNLFQLFGFHSYGLQATSFSAWTEKTAHPNCEDLPRFNSKSEGTTAEWGGRWN
jgi:hypothetical protein